MFLFSFAGATFGMCEEVMVFILITIPLAIALGYDSLTGIAMPFVGAASGFAGAFSNPFTVGIAQGISEIPIFSGWEYRIFVWLTLAAIAITFMMIYARRIEKDPKRSLVYDIDHSRDLSIFKTEEDMTFNLKRKMVLVIFFAAIIMLIVGVNIWDWYINEIAGLFIAMGLVTAILYRLPSNTTVAAFLDGARDMMTAAMVIGLTRGMIHCRVPQSRLRADDVPFSMCDELFRPIRIRTGRPDHAIDGPTERPDGNYTANSSTGLPTG
jgi:uncharacterized ion transporter superfamily protein YfcC